VRFPSPGGENSRDTKWREDAKPCDIGKRVRTGERTGVINCGSWSVSDQDRQLIEPVAQLVDLELVR
jgi:hypothetical protein